MFEDNLKKFLFVGVMIVVTLISNHTSKGNEQATVSFTLNGEPVNQEKTAVVAGSVTPSGTSGVLVEGSKKNDADLAPEPTDPAEKISASMLQQTGVVLGGGEKKDPEPEVVSGENFDRAFLTPEDRTVFEGQAEIEAGKSGSGFTKKSDQSFQNFSGSAALVADLLSGEEYLNLNGGRSWPIASITKLMTAAVASKNLDPELPIVVPVFGGELGGEVRKFNTGENVTMTNLLRLMLTASSNEAAEIFARAYGRASFIELMNVQAKAWGLKNTYFNDPTGLSVSNQSTPEDLKVLARKIYQDYPEIFKTTRRKSWTITENTTGRSIKVVSNNNFAGRVDFLGGKTGYTDDSNGNLLSIFLYGGRPIVVVALGTDDRFGETERLFSWFTKNYTY
jgi:D-alanyl-D-alanine endopeptidase (penicillin-binding protein 7)